MANDRRRNLRPTSDRRQSWRSSLFETLRWRAAGSNVSRHGTLVGVSKTGVALLTERPDTPVSGTRIERVRRTRRHLWRRPVEVVRVDRLSDLLDLVAAKYPARADYGQPREAQIP